MYRYGPTQNQQIWGGIGVLVWEAKSRGKRETMCQENAGASGDGHAARPGTTRIGSVMYGARTRYGVLCHPTPFPFPDGFAVSDRRMSPPTPTGPGLPRSRAVTPPPPQPTPPRAPPPRVAARRRRGSYGFWSPTRGAGCGCRSCCRRVRVTVLRTASRDRVDALCVMCWTQ